MTKFKERLYEIIFESDTRAGKNFDVMLMFIILLSVSLVLLDSVPSLRQRYHNFFLVSEWIITLIFTIEYILRIWIVRKPFRYMFSFFGIIDFLAVIPTFVGLIFMGYQSLLVIRILRLLRVFRILKLTRYSSAGELLTRAIWASREKISVFIFSVLLIVTIVGTMMYLIEGESSGFNSIPRSIYWAIVTLTTVGYGDISPVSAAGQFLASLVMIMGYAIIAVPTGIVTAQMISISQKRNTQVCPNCMHGNHEDDAVYCKKCGTELNP